MTRPGFDLRLGCPDDTPAIAELMVAAGGGLFEQLLEDVVPGASVETLLGLAINDESCGYHFQNALIATGSGATCGLGLAFPASQFGLPDAALQIIPPYRLAPLRGILESRVEGSFYVNSLAVRPAFGRLGVAHLLLRAMAQFAAAQGHDMLSLHVWSDNQPALALYRGLGFEHRLSIAVPSSDGLSRHGPMMLMAVTTEKLLSHAS